MKLRALFPRPDLILFGFVLGVAAAVVGQGVYHEIRGLVHLNVWERWFAERHQDRVAAILRSEVATATAAVRDGEELPISAFFAEEFMGRLYEHHMAWACALLREGAVDRFNQLRAATPFLLFDLSRQDLSGLDLTGVNLEGADLSGTRLTGAVLDEGRFLGAEMADADLTGASLNGSWFLQANLADAILNQVRGAGANFSDAVLAGASITGVGELDGAVFRHATMPQANLWQSRFQGADFDHADLSLVSAVDADLGDVAGAEAVNLAGANLAGALLRPDGMSRAWLVNARGVDHRLAEELVGFGAVFDADAVLDLVDSRIVAGFRAQIEQEPEIPAERRRPALLSMVRDYYLQ